MSLRLLALALTLYAYLELEASVAPPLLAARAVRRGGGGGGAAADSDSGGCLVHPIGPLQPYQEAPLLPLPPVFAAYAARPDKSGGVVLTYWNTHHLDGAGSQVQRIVGWYTLAASLGLGYLHSPLHHIGYQGLQALEAGAGSAALHARWVAATALPDAGGLGCSAAAGDGVAGRPPPSDGCRHVFFVEMTLEALAGHVAALAPGERLVLHGVWAHAVLDQHAYLARHPALRWGALLPWLRRAPPRAAPRLRVAVHVRRGELYVVDGHRMLPNAYYLHVCWVLGQVLREAGLPHVFEVYTEQVTKKITVTGASHGITNRTSAAVELAPEDTRLWELADILPQELYLNTDPLEAFQRMASAHVLVMSRSSFSYAAALLADPSATLALYPPDFWIAPLPGWRHVPKHVQKGAGNGEGRGAREALRRDLRGAVSALWAAAPGGACNDTMASLLGSFYGLGVGEE